MTSSSAPSPATSVVLTVNGENHALRVDPGTPLLWVLRDYLGMTGTKFGCGMSLCGACTVQVDGVPMRSCSMPVSLMQGRAISTIEGLASGDQLHPLQKAWVAENVPQCGYCQSGQLMAAEALLRSVPSPTDEDIDHAMSGNICRCGTYVRIRRAIKRAAMEMNGQGPATSPPDPQLRHVPRTASLPMVNKSLARGGRS